MVVRCVQELRGAVAGREYVALAVMVTPASSRPVMFMLHQPDEVVTDWAWYEARAFEVLDDALPSNWIYSANKPLQRSSRQVTYANTRPTEVH